MSLYAHIPNCVVFHLSLLGATLSTCRTEVFWLIQLISRLHTRMGMAAFLRLFGAYVFLGISSDSSRHPPVSARLRVHPARQIARLGDANKIIICRLEECCYLCTPHTEHVLRLGGWADAGAANFRILYSCTQGPQALRLH